MHTNEGIWADNIILPDKESNELRNVNSTILFTLFHYSNKGSAPNCCES
jgi:hypothetical protein